MPVLRPEQVEALATLDWLFSDDEPGHRRAGRTVVMALAFIRFALDHPNQWVGVFDHTATNERARNTTVLMYIEQWAREAGAPIEIQNYTSFPCFRLPEEGPSRARLSNYLRNLWTLHEPIEVVVSAPRPEPPRRTAWERLDDE